MIKIELGLPFEKSSKLMVLLIWSYIRCSENEFYAYLFYYQNTYTVTKNSRLPDIYIYSITGKKMNEKNENEIYITQKIIHMQ